MTGIAEVATAHGFTVLEENQRNWSQVSTLRSTDGSLAFAKQFQPRVGDLDFKGFKAELTSSQLAASILKSEEYEAIEAIAVDDDAAVIIYPYFSMVTPDQRIRSRNNWDRESWNRYFQVLRKVVAQLEFSASLPEAASLTSRPIGQGPLAVCFKGLEIRNTATDSDGTTRLFDLGPGYLGTSAEASARLIVSVALLNWGRPIRRWLSGPPRELVNDVVDHFRDVSTRDLCEREIDLQFSGRRRAFADQPLPARIAFLVLGLAYTERAKWLLRRSWNQR